MMFGCSSLAERSAARWKRSTNSLTKERENGRTLIATSRASWRSRALKTMAIPPRPNSSTISYSSLSCSRTSSRSVTSCCGSRTALTGVVALRSMPQERQNLLAFSFWVPQREQYIDSPGSRGKLRSGRSGCQLADAEPRCDDGHDQKSAARAAGRPGEPKPQPACGPAPPLGRLGERTAGRPGREARGEHVMRDAAGAGNAGVQRESRAQLVGPTGGALLLPPPICDGPRE